MQKDFTLYPEAFELKQLGFDEPCFGWYDSEYQEILNYVHTHNSCGWLNGNHCTAPTYSQAFRWFREQYELDSEIYMNHEYGVKFYTYLILKLEKSVVSHKSGYAVKQNTYEEAELACLRNLIKIVKEQTNGKQ